MLENEQTTCVVGSQHSLTHTHTHNAQASNYIKFFSQQLSDDGGKLGKA